VTCVGTGSIGATSWTWAFGDGTTASGAIRTHTYDGPGDYTVSLTVSNASGSDEDSSIVSVGG
jgi:PKD repeat protein